MINVNNQPKRDYCKEVQKMLSGKQVRAEIWNIIKTLRLKQSKNTYGPHLNEVNYHRFLVHTSKMITFNK